MKICEKFRVVVAMALSMTMLFVFMPDQVFAAELDTFVAEEDDTQDVEARTTYTDSVLWYSGKTSCTVKLTHNLTTSSYKQYTGTLAYGTSAVMVLSFKNQSTGSSYSLSFICDGTYRTEHPGTIIPVGYYTVTLASFPSSASLSTFTCNFVY